MDLALLRADRSPNRFRVTNAGVFGAAVAVVAAGVATGAMVWSSEIEDAAEIAWLVLLLLIMVFGLPAILLTVAVQRVRPHWLGTGSWALIPVAGVAGLATGVLLDAWLDLSGGGAAPAWWGVGVGAVAGFAGCVGVRSLNARRPRVVGASTD